MYKAQPEFRYVLLAPYRCRKTQFLSCTVPFPVLRGHMWLAAISSYKRLPCWVGQAWNIPIIVESSIEQRRKGLLWGHQHCLKGDPNFLHAPHLLSQIFP